MFVFAVLNVCEIKGLKRKRRVIYCDDPLPAGWYEKKGWSQSRVDQKGGRARGGFETGGVISVAGRRATTHRVTRPPSDQLLLCPWAARLEGAIKLLLDSLCT